MIRQADIAIFAAINTRLPPSLPTDPYNKFQRFQLQTTLYSLENPHCNLISSRYDSRDTFDTFSDFYKTRARKNVLQDPWCRIATSPHFLCPPCHRHIQGGSTSTRSSRPYRRSHIS